MLRRLTQLWPGLVSAPAEDQGEEGQQLVVDDDQMRELEQSTLEVFGNLYWTRLITMENYRSGE